MSELNDIASTNPEIGIALSTRPDLAIITGFQEVSKVLTNKDFLETAKNVTHDTTDMMKSVTHDATDMMKSVTHDATDMMKSISNDKKEVTLKELDISFENRKEQNRHDEFIISKQVELITKFLDQKQERFNSKLEFLKQQQISYDDLYKKELNLLNEHISFLETERAKLVDDKKRYISLSKELSDLEDSKFVLRQEYTKTTSKLTDTMKLLEVEDQFANPMEQIESSMKNNLLKSW